MSSIQAALSQPRLTVKVGSALLVAPDGNIRYDWLLSLAWDLSSIVRHDQEVIIVSSGAIALGRNVLGLHHKSLRLEEKQAAAAAGQIALASVWQNTLRRFGLKAAQLLVTPDDTEDRRRYLNARATIGTLFKLNAVPVVNENDTVATSEIRFGDNDRLAARVAVMASAQTLILLSDIDGLYTADPRKDSQAQHIAEVMEIDDKISSMAGESGSDYGSGGMVTKIAAAKIAASAGTSTIITQGDVKHPLEALRNGAKATIFHARVSSRRARKEWIAGSLRADARLTIDQGAAEALKNGSSLLPAGVLEINGHFARGDTVLIQDVNRLTLAKGICAYDSSDARLIVGRKSVEIEKILGWRGRDELVHRDDLVLL